MENEYFLEVIGQISHSMISLYKTDDVTWFILDDSVMDMEMLLSETDARRNRARIDK